MFGCCQQQAMGGWGKKRNGAWFHKRCFIRNEWVGFNFFPNYDFFVCFVYEGWCVGIFTGKDNVYPMYLKIYSRSNIIAFDYELKAFLSSIMNITIHR